MSSSKAIAMPQFDMHVVEIHDGHIGYLYLMVAGSASLDFFDRVVEFWCQI